MADKRFFFITYIKPIHPPDTKNQQFDKGRIELEEVGTKEEALAKIKSYKKWFVANRCADVKLWEHVPASDVPVLPEQQNP